MVFERLKIWSPLRTDKGQARSMQGLVSKVHACETQGLPRVAGLLKEAIELGDNKLILKRYSDLLEFLDGPYAGYCYKILNYGISLESTLLGKLKDLRKHFEAVQAQEVNPYLGEVNKLIAYFHNAIDNERKKARDFFWEFKMARDYTVAPFGELLNNLWTDARAVKRTVNPIKREVKSMDGFTDRMKKDPAQRQALLKHLESEYTKFYEIVKPDIDFLTDAQDRTLMILFGVKKSMVDSYAHIEAVQNLVDDQVIRAVLKKRDETIRHLDESVKKTYWREKQLLVDSE